MPEIKRLNYFDSQFLKEKDFQDEQAYHIRMRRLLNQRLYNWGIAYGLEVARVSNTEISITPGMAIDKDGREIILIGESGDPAPSNFNLSSFTGNAVVYLTIQYAEINDEKDRNPSGSTEKFIRITERPKYEAKTDVPLTDGSVIVLAKVTLENGTLTPRAIDRTVRSRALTPVIPPGSITVDRLVPNAIPPAAIGALPLTGGTITGSVTMNGTFGFTNSASPMMHIFQSGDSNPEKVILGHSPSFPNWGLSYRDVGDTFIFQSGGAPVMAIDLAKQNVGIGTDKPTTKLQIVGETTLINSNFTFKSTGDDAGDVIFMDSADRQKGRIWTNPGAGISGLNLSSGDNTADISINANGNVGIGTESPSAKLHVTGGTTILQQEPWQTPTLQNGWAIYGDGYNPPGYFKDSQGIVHLRGLVRSGNIKGIIFTLPAGYRPEFRELFVVGCYMSSAPGRNGSGYGRIDITANGEVTPWEGENLWMSLDGITFRAVVSGVRAFDIGPIFVNPAVLNRPLQ